MFKLIKSTVPEGTHGEHSIDKLVLTKDDVALFNLREELHGTHRTISPGSYTRLMRGSTVVMSDTPAELEDHHVPVHRAKGVCLVAGLGLGVVAESMAAKSEVERVVVIEKSLDVIALVAKHMRKQSDKIDIVHADIFDYKAPKGTHYGAIWFDIWDTICSDNLPEMRKLTKRYAKRTEWCGSWARAECRQALRRWGS